jgi:hypothetical protein
MAALTAIDVVLKESRIFIDGGSACRLCMPS